MHLALDLPGIYRPAAILYRNDALHAHDAGLGVDCHCGKLDAAQILVRQSSVAHAPPKPGIIVAARSDRADAIGAQPGGSLGETDAAARVVADQDFSAACEKVLRSRVERKPRLAQERLQHAPSSGARRRRDRRGRTAAVRGWAGRKFGVANAHRDLVGTKSKNLGDSL